jgi:hypothetical protein
MDKIYLDKDFEVLDSERLAYLKTLLPRKRYNLFKGLKIKDIFEEFDEEFERSGINPIGLMMSDIEEWKPIDNRVKLTIWFKYIFFQILYDVEVKGIRYDNLDEAMTYYNVDLKEAYGLFNDECILLGRIICALSGKPRGRHMGKVVNEIGEITISKLHISKERSDKNVKRKKVVSKRKSKSKIKNRKVEIKWLMK